MIEISHQAKYLVQIYENDIFNSFFWTDEAVEAYTSLKKSSKFISSVMLKKYISLEWKNK